MAGPSAVAEHVRAFVGTAVAVALVAGPVAVLWAHVVPHAGIVLDKFGDYVPAGHSNEFIRADGWFLVMTLIVGAICGAVAWACMGGRNPGAIAGLAVGSVFAGIAVARIGQQRNSHHLQLAARARESGLPNPLTSSYPPLMHGVLFAWAFAAVVVYGLLTAFVVRR
jgi:uncharacterized membrane protein YeaQ/YmgE (transglycosylase-associated protein family)